MCVCVCVCAHICVNVCVCVCPCACMHVCVHACICVHACVHACVCMYMCCRLRREQAVHSQTSSSSMDSCISLVSCLTGFCEPLSPPYWCHTSLKNVYCSQCWLTHPAISRQSHAHSLPPSIFPVFIHTIHLIMRKVSDTPSCFLTISCSLTA